MSSLEDVPAVATLDDPVRRRIYGFVRARDAAVSRDDVAGAVGISRKLAAFHLDKLVDRGFLVPSYARPVGRTGPGAGRPAKMYRPSSIQLGVSIPERRYDVVGEFLVDAIESTGGRGREAACRVARDRGVAAGERARRDQSLRRPGRERTMTAAISVLDEGGFEPFRDDAGGVSLRNCPFDSLARRAPDLVCEMNRSFVEGVVDGLGGSGVACALDRRPDRCCVVLRPEAAS